MASTVTFEGLPKVGGVVSWTVTLKVEFAAFERESVAVQVTVAVPMANVEPDAGAQETVTEPSTASVAVGDENVAVAPDAPVASTVIFEGVPEMTGPVVSCTVTVNVEV